MNDTSNVIEDQKEDHVDPRSNAALTTVRERVDGHGVDPGTEVTLLSGNTQTERVSGSIAFPLKARWKSWTEKGAKPQAGENGGNPDKAADSAMNQALQKKGPNWLLGELQNAPLKYAQKAESSFDLPLGRTFAQVKNCTEITCLLGRKQCLACTGRGNWLEFQSSTAPNGQVIRQQVRKTCMSCGGTGRVMCPTCGGTGHLTRIARMWIWTEPSSQFRVNSEDGEKFLSDFLGQGIPNLITGGHLRPEFTGSDLGKNGTGPPRLYFRAEEPFTVGKLQVRDLTYRFATFGPKNAWAFRPFIFDDLLKGVADHLQDKAGKRRAARMEGLKTATRWPVLEATLRRRAEDPQSLFASLLKKETGGLISKEFAERIGGSLKKIQDGLCPRWSFLPWAVLLAIASLPAFGLGTSLIHSENYWGLPLLAGISVTGLLVSKPLTALRRRKVPRVYRTPMAERRPAFVVPLLLAGITGISTFLPVHHPLRQDAREAWFGGMARMEQYAKTPLPRSLPQWADLQWAMSGTWLQEANLSTGLPFMGTEDTKEATSQANQALAELGFHSGDGTDPGSPAMEQALAEFQASRNLETTGELDSRTREALEWAWTVLRAQQTLNRRGLDAGAEDGIVGSQTRAALARFQRSRDLEESGRLNRPTIQALIPDFQPDLTAP